MVRSLWFDPTRAEPYDLPHSSDHTKKRLMIPKGQSEVVIQMDRLFNGQKKKGQTMIYKTLY
jgi:hypothetical protein